jgi:NADH-quinone oxidoreductase subunit C
MNSISSINYMVSFLSNTLSRGLVSISARSNKITISISNEVLRPVVNFLSKSTYIKANSLLDIWVVDYPERENRFEVNYLLLSVKYEMRYIVKTLVSEYKYIYSLSNLFPSAN